MWTLYVCFIAGSDRTVEAEQPSEPTQNEQPNLQLSWLVVNECDDVNEVESSDTELEDNVAESNCAASDDEFCKMEEMNNCM